MQDSKIMTLTLGNCQAQVVVPEERHVQTPDLTEEQIAEMEESWDRAHWQMQ